jgi:hypothetical protein
METKLVQAVGASTYLQTNNVVQSILSAYVDLVTEQTFNELRSAALRRHVLLQSSAFDQPVDSEELLITHSVCVRSHYNLQVWERIKNFHVKLCEMFPADQYTLSHRVSEIDHVTQKEQRNGLRAHFDTVGFRLVAHTPLGLITAIERIEQSALTILFRFNTYPFSDEEYRQRIGLNSSPCYRAVHYYVLLGSVIAEIQLRTASVDVWSEIHHHTLYKPTRSISVTDTEGIEALGQIANTVDLAGLLR